MIYIIVGILVLILAILVFMMYAAKKSPSIVGNDYDKEMQQKTNQSADSNRQ